LRAGPHVEQYTFISQDDPRRIENAQRRLFGIEGDGDILRYQLTALDQAITWDWRNDKLSTTRGSYYSLSAREAIPLSDAGYFFVRGSAEARRWVPLKVRRRGSFPLVLAGKIRGTVIFPLGDKNIPVPERAYLGGANSLRGFRPNQVGPYTTLCTVEEYETNGSLFGFGGGETETVDRVQLFHLPEGGNLALETSVELRYDWIYGIKLATFVDAGVLTPSIFEPAAWLDGFRASAGVGTRYDTLVGPFRFDLSFRPLYPEDDGPLRYAGGQCDPIDEQPRVYDFFSNFRGLRGDAHPPFAMVFFLTIGEAF
jgi:outer membrane protein assembly factor BamA